jgi:hypothetical protein
LTNRNNQPFWQTGPRTTKAQEKFNSEFRRNGNAARPTDLESRVQEILARPGARSSTGMLNPRVVSREDARLISLYQSRQPEKRTRFQKMKPRLPEALGALGRAFPATAAELSWGGAGRQFRELREQYGPTEAFRKWGEEGRPTVPSFKVPDFLRPEAKGPLARMLGVEGKRPWIVPEQLGVKGGLEVFAQPDVLVGGPGIKPLVRGAGQALRTGARAAPEVAQAAVSKVTHALPTERAYAFKAEPDYLTVKGTDKEIASTKKLIADGKKANVSTEELDNELSWLEGNRDILLEQELGPEEYARLEGLREQVTNISGRIYGIEGTSKIVRPNWAAGSRARAGAQSYPKLRDDQLTNMAREADVDPYSTDWGDSISDASIKEARSPHTHHSSHLTRTDGGWGQGGWYGLSCW